MAHKYLDDILPKVSPLTISNVMMKLEIKNGKAKD